MVGKKYQISVPVHCCDQCSAPLKPWDCCCISPGVSVDVSLHRLPNNTPGGAFLKPFIPQYQKEGRTVPWTVGVGAGGEDPPRGRQKPSGASPGLSLRLLPGLP